MEKVDYDSQFDLICCVMCWSQVSADCWICLNESLSVVTVHESKFQGFEEHQWVQPHATFHNDVYFGNQSIQEA